MKTENPIVFVLSDSVGETAELVIKAGLSQFTNGNYDIQRVPYVDDISVIDETLELAGEKSAFIAFTLVDPTLRKYMNERSNELNVDVIDIMGPMMDLMEKKFNHEPRLEPGLIYKLDQDYFERIEAIEFAVRYDDGRDPRGIARADIVLIGVSRTSKTPLSQYLAHKSYKVMNIPIVPEVVPPENLFNVDPSKCIALKISEEKLNRIRKERLRQLGLGESARYATEQRIKEELDYFHNLVEKIRCPVIDVSDKAIEETANDIISIIEHNNFKKGI